MDSEISLEEVLEVSRIYGEERARFSKSITDHKLEMNATLMWSAYLNSLPEMFHGAATLAHKKGFEEVQNDRS